MTQGILRVTNALGARGFGLGSLALVLSVAALLVSWDQYHLIRFFDTGFQAGPLGIRMDQRSLTVILLAAAYALGSRPAFRDHRFAKAGRLIPITLFWIAATVAALWLLLTVATRAVAAL